ncbi:hypothetical protein Tco_0681222 [Tanacetum coccineum]|uniref:Uncharacterized protein n=1 Tax=Tanacetum coccineum TaxID=301880 RepID=A0ABQ4XMP3_9ASTR
MDKNDQEDDDAHDDDKTADDNDDEELTESDNDGDDFVHPKLTTHDDEIIHEEETNEDDSSISSSDDEESDNDVEGANVAGAKSDEETTVKDSRNEAVKEYQYTILMKKKTTTEPLLSIDTSVTATMEPTFTCTNQYRLQHRILSSFKHNNHQLLKALEDNFSELRQTNQYAEALSSIPSTSPPAANQQFLESIDDGMKKIIKEQVKKEVSKIIPKVEKFVTDQLESEVLLTTSINRSDIQRQLYKDLVEAYEADKILLDTYGDTVTIKRPRDGADDDHEPSARTDRGSKRRRSGKEPASTSAPK